MTSDLFLDWHLRTKAPTVTQAIFQSGANASARTKPGSTDWALQEENDKRSETINLQGINPVIVGFIHIHLKLPCFELA